VALDPRLRGDERKIALYRGKFQAAADGHVLSMADDIPFDRNFDLPPESSYRTVSPMAATIRLENGTAQVTPWLIDYKRFNDPKRNRFFASPPEIEHKIG
jgi:hypothetical protein